jgi:hypothetical protein
LGEGGCGNKASHNFSLISRKELNSTPAALSPRGKKAQYPFDRKMFELRINVDDVRKTKMS